MPIWWQAGLAWRLPATRVIGVLSHDHDHGLGPAPGWMPPEEDGLHRWEEIPALAQAHSAGDTGSFFPLFEINPY
jgi:hypothetical protein